MVLADGQNIFKGCRNNYGHGYVHPLLLAHRVLAGRKLASVRYYTGLHHPRVNPNLNAAANRRHSLMRRMGLTVEERKLRYRWEWRVNKQDAYGLPEPVQDHKGETHQVRVEPFYQPREKGIDLSLGLDAVDFALTGKIDVLIIISSDTDLCEVARMVHQMTMQNGHRVSVEAAVFNDDRKPIVMKHYDHTHQLTRKDFDEARDSFDYTKELDAIWKEAYLKSCESLKPVGLDD